MTTTPAAVAAWHAVVAANDPAGIDAVLADQLVEFTTLVRPLKALQHLVPLMSAELARAAA
jgi:hypothetical protein